MTKLKPKFVEYDYKLAFVFKNKKESAEKRDNEKLKCHHLEKQVKKD